MFIQPLSQWSFRFFYISLPLHVIMYTVPRMWQILRSEQYWQSSVSHRLSYMRDDVRISLSGGRSKLAITPRDQCSKLILSLHELPHKD
ncbi:hypothetical protein Y032_0036g3169 [Ancylostoma ceylanicum]|uniref:Uncharacterized protein n=1 Tax=Ancylostoma ceylanicum TaxID=53326 RepID=A0A016ULU4_9BILA|nr:hypothetical protein Y032_0036g3169 [Ancylostoma ceylanicum]